MGSEWPCFKYETPCLAREVRDFHKFEAEWRPAACIDLNEYIMRKLGSDAAFARDLLRVCTKFGHRLVDGLHSIENTCTYKGVIFVDGNNRRSTTGSFFDSFLSFSGWCGVRGSSGVTVLIARLGRRVSEGL
jgi:hypothetical protein